MPTRMDAIFLNVVLAGVDVTANVERVRLRFGFDIRVSEAEVDFFTEPAFVDWGTLVIQAGINGNAVPRFNGFAIDNGADYWPWTTKLVGRGPLTLADRKVVPDDSWVDAVDPYANTAPLLIAASYDPPGIDMTNNGNGQLDSDQVTYILNQCGLSGYVATPSDIGGLLYLLGQTATDQFVWKRGQSGLAYIEQLDGMYGFRTFEVLNGLIKRQSVTPFAAFEQRTGDDLQEGRDILEGASIARDLENIRNRVVVTGYDDGGGGNAAVVVGALPAGALPPGINIATESYSSPLIERAFVIDPDPGLSCEETAKYWLEQSKYPMFEATLSTWRDDAWSPGSIQYVNAPHLLNVNQTMWVKGVTIEVTPSSFTQTLTLRAADYAVRRSYPSPPPNPPAVPPPSPVPTPGPPTGFRPRSLLGSMLLPERLGG